MTSAVDENLAESAEHTCPTTHGAVYFEQSVGTAKVAIQTMTGAMNEGDFGTARANLERARYYLTSCEKAIAEREAEVACEKLHAG